QAREPGSFGNEVHRPHDRRADVEGANRMPSAAANAAAFARKMVRARKGSGPSTITSRRSGKVESQLSTANSPTTSMVVAMRKCSVLQRIEMSFAGGIRRGSRNAAPTPTDELKKT